MDGLLGSDLEPDPDPGIWTWPGPWPDLRSGTPDRTLGPSDPGPWIWTLGPWIWDPGTLRSGTPDPGPGTQIQGSGQGPRKRPEKTLLTTLTDLLLANTRPRLGQYFETPCVAPHEEPLFIRISGFSQKGPFWAPNVSIPHGACFRKPTLPKGPNPPPSTFPPPGPGQIPLCVFGLGLCLLGSQAGSQNAPKSRKSGSPDPGIPGSGPLARTSKITILSTFQRFPGVWPGPWPGPQI